MYSLFLKNGMSVVDSRLSDEVSNINTFKLGNQLFSVLEL